MKRFFILFAVISFYSHQSHAWGKVGHETTALVGEAYLTPEAQAAINDILDGKRLIEVSTWADQVRDLPEYKHTAPYHYQNTRMKVAPFGKANVYLQNLTSMAEKAKAVSSVGVVEAIAASQKVLSNPNATKVEKQLALKFLVHFVADLHQPLHTGEAKKFGGNGITLEWGGRKTNLHKVWDTDLIDDRLAELNKEKGSHPALNYAQWLIDTYPEISQAKAETQDITKWYQESLDLQSSAYDEIYLTDPSNYALQANPMIDHRILLGGKRMGELLNQLLGNSQIPTVSRQMIQTAEKVFGKLESLISFGPRTEKSGTVSLIRGRSRP